MPELTASTREAARRLGVSDTAIHKAERAGRIAREPDGQWDIDKTRRRLTETADPARSPLASGAGADGTPFARLLDTTAARSNSYVRHQQIPEPNALYRFRIRVRNRQAINGISAVANNGGGAVRITRAAHGFATNDVVTVADVSGVPGANGTFTITVIDANSFDLVGSTFTGAYLNTGWASVSRMRVTPAQMVASGQAFLRPFKSGRGFVWCLPLHQGEQTGRRRRTRLVAGGVTEVGTANRKGREAWARGLLEQGMVPMFLLLPQVKLSKRLDVRGAAERGLRRLPGRFVAAWDRESGRAA